MEKEKKKEKKDYGFKEIIEFLIVVIAIFALIYFVSATTSDIKDTKEDWSKQNENILINKN